MKICDFDQHFLLVSHMPNVCPFGAKRCHSIAKRLILQNVKKIKHRIVFVLQRINVGLPFFDTHCRV